MKILLTCVPVDDQEKALRFYTEVLGFVEKAVAPEANWLTVASPTEPEGPQIFLEPNDHPALEGATQHYQKILYEAGIPWTSFAVEDVREEYERMKKLGVVFTLAPTQAGPATVAILDDTCGNLIQIAQQVEEPSPVGGLPDYSPRTRYNSPRSKPRSR
jgi:catechol 2,3-dioxygenase-like lactoylglutathione lyase family enzyme